MDLFDDDDDETPDDGGFEDDGSELRPLRSYVEEAYRNYSIYVIHDRALPHIGDGLKPVQRRILYAMSQLSLWPNSKHKKSARTVGDVLGKYHPHGDSACYEAMVLLAQDFSTRYPLIDGQGNWGTSDDPKSFAAMRYTESRLTRFAHEVLLGELKQGTVDPFIKNFDGTMKEPQVLPARLPLLLCNGVTGIAVGMATDIPPHNVREVVEATIALIDKKSTTVDELCELIPGPDFPTEAQIITPAEEMREIYRTGNGSVRARAVWQVEEGDIVVHALPYQVSSSKIVQQIAEQMRAKKLPMVTNVADESDFNHDTRLVISHKRGTDREQLMGHLFATTDLERTYRVNMNVLGLAVDGEGNKTIFPGRPVRFDLRTLLLEWIDFRRIATLNRMRFELAQVEQRLEKLAAWLIAHLNIDEVIAIIREHDEPKPVLMERFDLTDFQAEAILELKLRNLRKLEEMKIRGEQEEKEKRADWLRKTMGSAARLKTQMKKELREILEVVDDERRSPIVEDATAASALDETQLITSEPRVVVLSEQGWVRAGKGHDLDVESLTYKGNDTYLDHALGRNTWNAAFLDTTGRAYSLLVNNLKSARGVGEPLTSYFKTPPGARFVSCLCGEEQELYIMASDAGYGFVCQLGDLFGRNKAGKRVLTVPANSRPVMPAKVADAEGAMVVCVSSVGRMLAFPLAELPQMARGKGNKLIAIKAALLARGEERMVGALAVSEGQKILVHSGKRYTRLKMADLEAYTGMRGRRGDLLPKGFRNVDRIEIEKA